MSVTHCLRCIGTFTATHRRGTDTWLLLSARARVCVPKTPVFYCHWHSLSLVINMIGVEIYAEAIVNVLKSEIEHHIA